MNYANWGTLASRWFLALTICLGANTMVHAQRWSGADSFDGVGSDFGIDIKINQAGEYLTGYFSGSVTFGNTTLVSAGGSDIFLAKFGSWAVQIGGASTDEPTNLALDGAGNIYLTGWFTTSAAFHSTNGSSVTATGNGETSFLAKYTPSGVLAWVQTGVGSEGLNDRGMGLAVDTATGAVYWTGFTMLGTTFSSANGHSISVPGPWVWHMFLVKYDTNGNVQWGESNSASPNSISDKVAVGPDGSAYAAGWFEGQVTFYSADGHNQTITGLSQPVQTPPDYPGDGFVVKYDSNGNLKWVNDIGGYKANMNDIVVSSSGLVSVTGLIGNIDGNTQQQETLVLSQPPGDTINLGGGIYTTPYNKDVIVATYNESGVALSAHRIGGAANEEGDAILSSGNDLYVLEKLDDTDNLAIFKLEDDMVEWTIEGGGNSLSGENWTRMTLAPDGRIVAIGGFTGTATFGWFTLSTQGVTDGFVVNLAP